MGDGKGKACKVRGPGCHRFGVDFTLGKLVRKLLMMFIGIGAGNEYQIGFRDACQVLNHNGILFRRFILALRHRIVHVAFRFHDYGIGDNAVFRVIVPGAHRDFGVMLLLAQQLNGILNVVILRRGVARLVILRRGVARLRILRRGAVRLAILRRGVARLVILRRGVVRLVILRRGVACSRILRPGVACLRILRRAVACLWVLRRAVVRLRILRRNVARLRILRHAVACSRILRRIVARLVILRRGVVNRGDIIGGAVRDRQSPGRANE